MRTVHRYLLGALLLAGLVALVLLTARRTPDPDADRPVGPRPRAHEEEGPPREARFRGFVGSRVCNDCHAEIFASYQRSGMAASWQPVGDELPEYFHQRDVIADAQGLYRYRVGVDEDGRPFQEETLVEQASPPAPLRRTPRYLVGSGHHAQALVTESNGYLHQMPLAWFASEKQWRLNPGFENYNHRFGRPIVPECIACHGTYAEHRPPTQNRYLQPVPQGIGCERCHGPGADHVARWQGHSQIEGDEEGRAGPVVRGSPDRSVVRGSPDPAQSSDRRSPAGSGRPSVVSVARSGDRATTGEEGRVRGDVVNPARLPADRANDVCLQCHLQGDASIYREGSDPFSFRPGERLRDHRVDFLAQTQGEAAFGVASHGARLLQSDCYRKSDGLTCFTCHDPHRPTADFPKSYFDARCVDCHQPQDCSREAPPEEKRRPAGCVDCHMPQRGTRESIHLVFTDHWIRRRPVAPASAEPLSPNADVTLVSPWPGEEIDPALLGAAYVWLHETMTPQEPSLQRGVKMLGDLAAAGALDAHGKYWFGSGLVSQRRSEEAIRVLGSLLRELNDSAAAEGAGGGRQTGSLPHEARFRLAIAYNQLGGFDRAADEYERLIAAAPDWLEPYPLLSRIHLFRGRTARAVEVLRRQLEYFPSAEAKADLALALWLTGRPPQECLPLTDEALQLDPRNTRVLLVRGQLFTAAGDVQRAAESYRQVLRIQPGHPTAQEALKALTTE